MNKLSEVAWVFSGVLEYGDAECAKHSPEVQHQHELGYHVLQYYTYSHLFRLHVRVSVDQSWRQKVVSESSQLSRCVFNSDYWLINLL